MNIYIQFDPSCIEDSVYSRLDEDTQKMLSNSSIIKEMNLIKMKKASRILEDDDVNILNF